MELLTITHAVKERDDWGGEKKVLNREPAFISDGAEAVFCFAAISHYFYQLPA